MARGKVTIPITFESSGARRGAREAEQALKRIEGAVTVSFGKMAKRAAQLAAAYAGISEVKKAVSATEQLGKVTLALNRNMGFSVRTASELGAQLIARGADVSRVNMMFGTLNRQITAATKGTKSAVEVFQQLGISQKELRQLSPDRLLTEIADGMNRLSSDGQRTAIAMRLFGRGWQVLRPLLGSGSEELRKQLETARRYGATLGGRSLNSIKEWIAAQREAKLATLGLQVTVGTTLMPFLTDLVSWTARTVANLRDFAKQTGIADAATKAISSTVSTASDAFEWLATQVKKGTAAGAGLLALVGALTGRIVALRVAATVAAAVSALGAAFRGASIGATLLNLALGANPIVRVITVVMMLAGAVGLLAARFPGVRKAAENVMRAVGSAVGAAAKAVGSAASAIGSALGRVAKTLGGVFSAGWRIASGVVRTYVGLWSRIVRAYVTVVSTVVSRVAGLLRGAFSTGWRLASGAVKAAGSVIGDAVNAIGKVVSKVFGAVRSIVNKAASGFRALGSAVAKVRDLIKGAAGAIGKVAGALNPFGDGVGVGAVGPAIPSGRSGLFAAAQLARQFGLAPTSFVRPGARTVTGGLSYHALGRAMDFAGPPGAMLAFAKAIARLAGPRLLELIHSPLGWGIKNGRVVPLSYFGPAVIRQHYNHVHVAMRQGGLVPGSGLGDKVPALLEPGEFVVPRRVVEAVGPEVFEQLRMRRGGRVRRRPRATRGRAGYNTEELLTILEARQTRAETTPGLRDDFEVAVNQANLIHRRILSARQRIRAINRALRGRLTPGTRRRLLEERAELLRQIASDERALSDIGRRVGQAVDAGAVRPEVAEAFGRAFGFRVQREPAPADTGTGAGGADQGESELAEVMRELANLVRQQVETQQRLVALTEREGPALVSAVAAAVSGMIGGRASLLAQVPAAGRLARY